MLKSELHEAIFQSDLQLFGKRPIFLGMNIQKVCILIFSPHFFLLQLEMEQDDVIEVYQEQTGGFYRS